MTVTAPTKTHVDTALENVRSAMSEHEVDALLVTYPPNVRYLTGFSSPEDASVLVLPDRAVMLTDGRYTAQAQEEALLPYEIVTSADSRIADLSTGLRLGVEAEHMTLKRNRELTEKLGRSEEHTSELQSRENLVC